MTERETLLPQDTTRQDHSEGRADATHTSLPAPDVRNDTGSLTVHRVGGRLHNTLRSTQKTPRKGLARTLQLAAPCLDNVH